MKKLLAEFFGSMIMILSGCISSIVISAMYQYAGIAVPILFGIIPMALAFGLGAMAAYYIFEDVSGGYGNPAISLGAAMAGRLTVKEFFIYMIAEVLGAICATGFAAGVLGYREVLFASGYGKMSEFGTSPVTALVMEVLMTFVLVLLFLKVSGKKELKSTAGLIIGLGYVMVYIPELLFYNGGSNPAKAFATALFQTTGDPLKQVWVFALAPFIGAVIAAMLYIFTDTDAAAEIERIEAENEIAKILEEE